MVGFVFLFAMAATEAAGNPLVQVEEDPALPRVLLIGDSISMGYTLPLRDKLKNRANVQHPTENCGSSRRIVERFDGYLGKKPWDVVVFNCGIHDLTHLDKAGVAAIPERGGKLQVPLDEYRANLETIVARLKKKGAQLIWCATTPVSKSVAIRKSEDVARYNAVAEEVMRRHRIQVADLHSPGDKKRAPKLSPDGVHFTPQGYGELANVLAPIIEKSLSKSRQ